MKKNNLWEDIEKFDFDSPPSEYGFSVRLAHENGWSLNFTQKAITEYKKFMFLASISKEMVSPSEIVDTVWHQHLLFSHSYAFLCQRLGKWIEHIPSTHQSSEKHKFTQAKKHTRELYEEHFGQMPHDIWQNHTILGDFDKDYSSLKQQIHFVVFLLAALFCYPFMEFLKPLLVTIDSPLFLIGYTTLIVVVGVWGYFATKNYMQENFFRLVQKIPLLRNLHFLELIYLKNSKIAHVMHAITNELIKKKWVQVTVNDQLEAIEHNSPMNFYEQIVYNHIKQCERVYYTDLVNYFLAKPMFTQISIFSDSLKKALQSTQMHVRYYWTQVIVFYSIFLIGFSRLWLGIEREKPVLYLFVLLALYGIVYLVWGKKLESLLFTQIIPQYYHAEKKSLEETDFSYASWEYLMAGKAVLVSSFAPVITFYNQKQHKDGSNASSCGSGCGSSCGGSCGGGCGGCGG